MCWNDGLRTIKSGIEVEVLSSSYPQNKFPESSPAVLQKVSPRSHSLLLSR